MKVDELVEQCQVAIGETEPRLAVRDVLNRAVSDNELADSLGPATSGLNFIHRAPDLTVINDVWPPGFALAPHDHRMWAAIAIYGGRETNAFFRRQASTIVASGGKELAQGDVALLGDDTIHSVTNPARTHTGAIHVYGGDFVATPRSQWDVDTLTEEPYDIEAVRRAFARAEEALRADSHADGSRP
jgi:predicted metal-dependent enzyme (double-stranded beta helix superfamily)